MLRMFGFLPPVGCYVLATVVLALTYGAHMAVIESGAPPDTRIFVVGGILAFLLAFAGHQKYLADREEASRPRVSSSDVMQKLVPKETGTKDEALDMPPQIVSGPAPGSPLARVRAKSAGTSN